MVIVKNIPQFCLNKIKRKVALSLIACSFFNFSSSFAQEGSKRPSSESDYYQLMTLPIPEGVSLEVGGLASLPDGRLAVSTRRGEIWMITNPYMENLTKPTFTRFATGLADILGLAYKDGGMYFSQRGELTKASDTNGDGKADNFETVYRWPLSGHYHEYSYGPFLHPDGSMYVTLNVSFHPIEWWKAESLAKWRGWMLKISPDGQMTPIATGLRSPTGVGFNKEGDVFYSENQGDWVGTGGITHVEKGDFVGNPAGLVWTHLPESPLKLKYEDIPDSGEPMFEVAKKIKNLKTQTVSLPHTILGQSTSGILLNSDKGNFAPFFEGQLFIGDQAQSKIMRVSLEKVNGQYQGAAFPFIEGFSSGILRMTWGNDGSLFVGMTNRGWGSTGKEPYGVQRVVWTGKTPFEIKTMSAKPDGFELEFTKPLDKKTASDLASYKVTGFTYKYHHEYGSPITNQEDCSVRGVVVSEDGLKARVVVDNLREGYIHEVKADGVMDQNGMALLHNTGYYTLKSIPIGEKLTLNSFVASHKHQMGVDMKKDAAKKGKENKNVPVKLTSNSASTSTAKRMTEMPSSWTKGPDQTITIGTKPGLKFDAAPIQVKAGSKIKLTFNNNDDMLHNLVLVTPDQAIAVGEAAFKMGLEATKNDYVPKTEKVIAHTKLLQPMSSETIYFTVPSKPGVYTIVCTFPGHYYVMQEKFKVIE